MFTKANSKGSTSTPTTTIYRIQLKHLKKSIWKIIPLWTVNPYMISKAILAIYLKNFPNYCTQHWHRMYRQFYSSGQKNVAVWVPFRLVCSECNDRSVALRFWYGTCLNWLVHSFPVYNAAQCNVAPTHVWNLISLYLWKLYLCTYANWYRAGASLTKLRSVQTAVLQNKVKIFACTLPESTWHHPDLHVHLVYAYYR